MSDKPSREEEAEALRKVVEAFENYLLLFANEEARGDWHLSSAIVSARMVSMSSDSERLIALTLAGNNPESVGLSSYALSMFSNAMMPS